MIWFIRVYGLIVISLRKGVSNPRGSKVKSLFTQFFGIYLITHGDDFKEGLFVRNRFLPFQKEHSALVNTKKKTTFTVRFTQHTGLQYY